MTKVISVAALIAGMATASFAGTIAPTNDQVVQDDVFVAPSSSAGIALPLAIGGGLVAIGLIASDSDDGAVATTTGQSD